MDVTCERCGTEYEFDETLVSERGTTVKCTNCGHLFKVFRGSSGGTPLPGAEPKTWTLRTGDGDRRPIASLKELQRFITEGRVTEDDQISRSGEGWKRLGDIAELQTFFAAARAAAVAPRQERRDGTARGITRDRNDPPPRSQGPAAQPPRPKGTMLGIGGAAEEAEEGERRETHKMAVPPPAQPAPSPPARARAPTPEPQPEPEHRATAGRGHPTTRRDLASPPPAGSPPPAEERRDPSDRQRRERAMTEADGTPSVPPTATARMGSGHPAPPRAPSQRPPAPRAAESVATVTPGRGPDRSTSNRPPPLRVDDDDDVPMGLPKRRGGSAFWVGGLVLVAIGVGVALQWERIQGLIGGGSAGAEFLDVADEHLAQDRDDAYRDAASEYTKALAMDAHDVRAMVGLSRAHALLSQSHLFAADDLEARAADDAALRGEASALRREAATLAGEARESAEAAVRVGTGGADAEVALADALRLSTDPLARSRIDRARTLEPTASAEALRVDALITAGESPTGLAAAIPMIEQAVAEAPSLLRVRLLLARAHLSAGDLAAARAQVQAVLARAPEHPLALALSLRLGAGVAGSPDGGSLLVAATGLDIAPLLPPLVPPLAPVAADPGEATDPGSSSGGGSSGAAGSSGGGRRSYEALVADADAAAEGGHAARARTLYEQALSARPGGSEALTGLGFALMETGDVNGALARFRTASSAGYANALIGMGDAYRRLGDHEHALEAYESYLARSPSGQWAAAARRHVDRLRHEGAGAATGSSGGSSSGAPSSSGGSSSGGSSSGGSSSGSSGGTEPDPGGDAPPTPHGTLPAPHGTTEHPRTDTPVLENEP